MLTRVAGCGIMLGMMGEQGAMSEHDDDYRPETVIPWGCTALVLWGIVVMIGLAFWHS
jgi:hypothetical protein